MNCPYCGHSDSKVIDSRDTWDGIRRRRQCLSCNERFTTYERLQPVSIYVIKKDRRREEFNKEKLLSGIRKACEKRPLPTGAIDRLVDDIEAEIEGLNKAEISSAAIGDMVMKRLKNLDYIAYIRFASVYRDFTDITALQREIENLVSDEPPDDDLTSQLPLIPEDELGTPTKPRHRSRR
ncbi:MAG: transcriptional repressor NrdR [Dehalococcoidales bacterium]|jgi:transcriptional repressor NrdR|nr:transcriptional repressor NrdR [Dehalococcoidales bacterium]